MSLSNRMYSWGEEVNEVPSVEERGLENLDGKNEYMIIYHNADEINRLSLLNLDTGKEVKTKKVFGVVRDTYQKSGELHVNLGFLAARTMSILPIGAFSGAFVSFSG